MVGGVYGYSIVANVVVVIVLSWKPFKISYLPNHVENCFSVALMLMCWI